MSVASTRSGRRWRALVVLQVALILASLSVPMAATAAVTSVTPNSQAQGTTVSISIAGSGGTFSTNGTYTVTFSGTGVTASGVARQSAVELTASVTATAGAATGARTLTVSGPAGFGPPQTLTYTITGAKIDIKGSGAVTVKGSTVDNN